MKPEDAYAAIMEAFRDVAEPWMETREDGRLEMVFRDYSEFIVTVTRK